MKTEDGRRKSEIGRLAYVALGSNLGNSIQLIQRAIKRLQQLANAALLKSSLWRTAPVDCPPGSPVFVNAVVGLAPAPGETAESLFAKLQGIEQEFGRKPKTVLNEPRTLDLDLISFGNEIRATPELTLPHPRTHLRRFVLQPLGEIAPSLILPGQARTVAELLRGLPPDKTIRRLSQNP